MGKGIHAIIPLSKERETERQIHDNYRLGLHFLCILWTIYVPS